MTVIFPITPAQLSIKLKAESIEVWQASQRLPDVGYAKEIAQEYSQTLEIMSESVDELIVNKAHERLAESYIALKGQIEERLDCVTASEPESTDALIRNAVERQTAMFLLKEISKMGIF